MLRDVLQPSVLSLFSSVGSDPLALFSTHIDPSLPADSHIGIVHDGTGLPFEESGGSDRTYLTAEKIDEDDAMRGAISHPVLHLQSPILPSTFIRSPAMGSAQGLGIRLPWMYIQARNLGKPWSFEFGIVDSCGREGTIRCSTFQERHVLHPSHPPLLHIPLSLPSLNNTSLSPWNSIPIHIPSLVPHFTSSKPEPVDAADDPVSSIQIGPFPTTFAFVTYVQIYANCRLRRIWFREAREVGGMHNIREFELYAASS